MRVAFFLLFFIRATTLLAQNSDSTRLEKKQKSIVDTNYIKSYKEHLSLGIFIAAPVNTLTITPKDSTVKAIQYKTNLSSIIGFTFGYKSITGHFGFRVPIEASQTNSYGNTSFKSFGIGTQKTRFSVRFDFRKTSGYYNEDSIVTQSTTETTYLKRGDVNSRQYMLSGLYNFSWKKYSYLSSFNFIEHQLKTRVGFIIKSSISSNQLKSDSSLISLKDAIINTEDIQQLNYTSFLVGPGMGLNVVIAKRFYFSLMTFLSYNYVNYKFIDNNDIVIFQNNSITAFLEGRASFGYHSKRFYAGIKFIADQIAVQTTDYKVENKFGAVTLDIGYRFNAPGILKKLYKKTFTKYLGL